MESKITVIMRTYNRADTYLKEAIEGVLYQSESNFEFIIYNNGSTDNTDDIVNKYKDSRIKYIKKEKNKVRSVSRILELLDLVSTEYCIMTHDDDVMHKDMLAREKEVLDNNKEIGLVACNVNIINQNGERLYSSNPGKHTTDLFVYDKYEYIKNFLKLKNNNSIWCPTAMVRTDLLKKVNFDFLDKSVIDDVYEWFQINEVSKMGILSKELYYYRMSGNQGSMDKLKFYESLYSYALPYIKKYADTIEEGTKAEKSLFDKLEASKKNKWILNKMKSQYTLDITELENLYKQQTKPVQLEIDELNRLLFLHKIKYLREKYIDQKIKYVIYGAGTAGQKSKYMVDLLLPNFTCIGFLDTYKSGMVDGYSIYKYADFDFNLCDLVIIGTTVAANEISELLEKKELKPLENYIFGYGID